MFSDLGIDAPFVWGYDRRVKNCWHFSTDGNAVDTMFYDDDFMAGMNRVFVVVKGYRIIILAFTLMDTHVHFVLYGEFAECDRFMHDYVQRTSRYLAQVHGERNKLCRVPINWQEIDTEDYLKTAVCYVMKNAPVGGKAFSSYDYPWSSGPLYFRTVGTWCSPGWKELPLSETTEGMTVKEKRETLHTREVGGMMPVMIGSLVFPGEYVDYVAVEKIFRTHKAFNYFLCKSKEDDVESRGGNLSLLSLPMQEMRQHKNEVCQELFGHSSSNRLNTQQRLRLARTLRSRFNSSLKQIARLCGLVYSEVKDLI